MPWWLHWLKPGNFGCPSVRISGLIAVDLTHWVTFVCYRRLLPGLAAVGLSLAGISCLEIWRAWPLLALALVMDPERDGYISLEEESTMSPQQGADNPNGEEPRGPRPAEEEAEPSEPCSAEWVEEGVPEEPCYYGHGLAWNNRYWRGWKPRETPRMPPKDSVSVDMQQVKPPSDRTQPTGQLQPPSRGIDHEEFCKILNEMPLPNDDAERANFDQQDVFILGDPAASFDRSGSHSYDRKTSDPHAGLPEWKKIFSYTVSSGIVDIWWIMIQSTS